MKLSAEQISSNYKTLLSRIEKVFPTRSDSLIKLYSDLGEERIMFAPASGTDHYHNAIPGGYVDHVLRVMNFSLKVYANWETLGMDISNFTKEELLFAALNHDLGKLGFIGDNKEGYIVNDSDWHRKNLGKLYKANDQIPYAAVPLRSLFLLQSYFVPVSWNEYLGIYLHDGLYDESNKSYFMNYSLEGKMRCNLPKILHQADLMASQFEFERWNAKENALNMQSIETSVVERVIKAPKANSKKETPPALLDTFSTLFETKEG